MGRLLEELGYADVEVIGRSGDGGVDVRCVLRAPLVAPPLTVVCQVKRHATNIGPGAVGDLRGRWAHRADRLILVNTAGFTGGAREAAREPGAKEIGLVTGEDLADLMIQKGIGITKEPVVMEKLDEAFFSEFSR
ncbi:MAG: restriction endonuclease [Dehalococcoidia bacterium]